VGTFSEAAAAAEPAATQNSATATIPNKRVRQSPEFIAAYIDRANNGLAEVAAIAELEQAKKRLKRAEELVSAASSQVAADAENKLRSQQRFDYDSRDVSWMSNYGKLVEFHKQNGHCRVPQKAERGWRGREPMLEERI